MSAENKPMTLPELIASEVMNTIERERRINKDDLIMAAEVAIGKFKAHPPVMKPPASAFEPMLESAAAYKAEHNANLARKLMVHKQQQAASVHHVNIATSEPPSFTHTYTNIAASCTASAGLGYQDVQIVNDLASSVHQYEIYGDTTWVKTKSTT